MVDRVQFEETTIPSTPVRHIPSSRMVAFLIEKGIVKTQTQASILLIVIAIACFAGAVFFSMSAVTEDEVYVVEPPIEERPYNNR